MSTPSCCQALSNGIDDTTCQRDDVLKQRLEVLAERARQTYAELSAAVCSTNKKCSTQYQQQLDAKKFICGYQPIDNKGWQDAAIILAIVMGILVSFYFLTRSSPNTNNIDSLAGF